MNTFNIRSHDPQETVTVGCLLAKHLKAGDIVCLFGDLGSGKTTLVKGLAEGLGIQETKVVSPTFVLLNIYKGKLPLYHFDFYRIEKVDEIALIGYEEFLYGSGIAVVEWAERLRSLMPPEHLAIQLVHKGGDERELTFKAYGQWHKQVIAKIRTEI